MHRDGGFWALFCLCQACTDPSPLWPFGIVHSNIFWADVICASPDIQIPGYGWRRLQLYLTQDSVGFKIREVSLGRDP